VTHKNSPPRRLEPEAAHVVPAAPAVSYLTPDSGYASTIKCAPRAYRFFRNFYICQRCPHEFCDEGMVAGPAWCPSCDEATEPYLSIDLLEPEEA
jgi:hypothetical protein